MLQPDQLRVLQVKLADGWVEANFGALEPGDVFRLLDTDGTVHKDSEGRSEFKVVSHPSVECEGQETCTPFLNGSISYSAQSD